MNWFFSSLLGGGPSVASLERQSMNWLLLNRMLVYDMRAMITGEITQVIPLTIWEDGSNRITGL